MISKPDRTEARATEGSALIAALVEFCCDRARLVAALGAVLGVAAGAYTAANFAITTDTDQLLSALRMWLHR